MHNHGIASGNKRRVARARAVVCYFFDDALDAENGIMGNEGEGEGIEDRAVMKCVSDMDCDGIAGSCPGNIGCDRGSLAPLQEQERKT